MARRSRVLLLALAAALVGSVAAAGRSLQQADVSDPAPGGNATRSGLEMVESLAGVGALSGRTLNDLFGLYPTGLFFTSATDGLGTYTDNYGSIDTIKTVNMSIGNSTAGFNSGGVGILSDPQDAISKPYLWLTDSHGLTVNKVDTVLGTVVGSFYSQPTGGALPCYGLSISCVLLPLLQ